MALHWLTALLVIGNLAGGHLIDTVMDSADPARKAIGPTIVSLHISFGLTILALSLVRLGWRLANPPPPLPAYMTGLERLLTGAVHIGFYTLLLLLPLSGWAMASTGATSGSLAWFGLVSVPPLPLPRSLHGLFRNGHGLFGWAMLALVALHIGAAVKHRILDRDDLLGRMLPRR